MLPSELYMASRLKLMFLLFVENPRYNLMSKYRLMKDRINELAHQFRCNILQMKNTDFRNSPLSLQGWRIDSDRRYLHYLSYMKLFYSSFPLCVLNREQKFLSP